MEEEISGQSERVENGAALPSTPASLLNGHPFGSLQESSLNNELVLSYTRATWECRGPSQAVAPFQLKRKHE